MPCKQASHSQRNVTLAKPRPADTLAEKPIRHEEIDLHGKALQLLAITVLGRSRPETVLRLTRCISDVGCNILESRMAYLGAEFAMLVLAEGPWDAIARLEQTTAKLERELGVRFVTNRTESRSPALDRIPYAVDVVCLDQPGVVHHLVDFFLAGDINIAELNTRTYPALHTGAPMLSVQMAVNIPADTHIGTLREHFTEFCDRFNLDAVLEPIKS